MTGRVKSGLPEADMNFSSLQKEIKVLHILSLPLFINYTEIYTVENSQTPAFKSCDHDSSSQCFTSARLIVYQNFT